MAPSSSPHSPLPLRKLLKTDTKTKPVVAAPLNSASSSSTTIPPPEKRTRDLPNLSDCHCCGRRINHTNPKDRLQPLDSVWRIVLLCGRCCKKVNSGQTCPYCFKETEHSGDLFRCCVCQHKVHKDCAGDYRNCAPFCYLGVDLGFRVCVDCWVPDPLKNSVRICGRSENKDSSEKTVKDANHHGNEVKMAVNDKDRPLKKATPAKNSANNVKHILDFVRKKNRDELKDASSDCSEKINVFDDAELAFRLHSAMNSSPRVLRDKSPVNSCSDDLKNGNSNGLSCKGLVLGGDQSKNESATANSVLQRKDSGTGGPIKWTDDIWEILVCVSSGQSGSCIHINRFGQDPVVYKRIRFRQKACKENGMVECSSFDNLGATFEFQNHQPDDTAHELPLVESGTVCVAQCNTEACLPNGNCNAENDRYFLKYTRTDRGFKCGDKLILPDRSCITDSDAESERYFVKYSKRTKCSESGSTGPVFDTFLSAKQACTPCLQDLQAAYPEKFDDELNLPHGGDDEESDWFFFKYVKRTKVSHSGSVVEANPHSDTELRKISHHH